MIKKAAMFGLDARIALAIFGALSVISGASLYSAIQESKMTAMYTSLVAVEKAIEQMYLDNAEVGAYKAISSYKLVGLLKNYYSLSNWQGPYLENAIIYGSPLTSTTVHLANFGRISGDSRKTRTLADNLACGINVATADTNIYINIDNVPDNTLCNGDLEYLKKVHDKFDSDGDYLDGKLKVIAHSTNTTEGSLFYRLDLLATRP